MKKGSSPFLTPFSLTVFCLSACVSSRETILAKKSAYRYRIVVWWTTQAPPSHKRAILYLLFIYYSFISNQPPLRPSLPSPFHSHTVHLLPSLVRKLLGPLSWLDCCRGFPANKPHPLPSWPTFQSATAPCSVCPTNDSAGVVLFEKKPNSLFALGFF